VKATPPKGWRPGETIGATLGLLIWGGAYAGIFWSLRDYVQAEAMFGGWIGLVAFVGAGVALFAFSYLWLDVLGWKDK
jgi:hypothetical protein